MKIYLAARYIRCMEMCFNEADLRGAGHVVTSRWIRGGDEIDDEDRAALQNAISAQEDVEDLLAADCVICFTEEPGGRNGRGGRHVEFGMALALKKTMIIIGPRENVFHYLPEVMHFANWEEFWEAWEEVGPQEASGA